MDHEGGVITDFLQGKRVCVTGQLASMTHAELAELVELCGGVFLRAPRRAGFLLVVGNMAWGGGDQDSTTHIFQHARRLRAYGYEIPFLTEEEFLERLGLIDAARAIRGQHTISDLARILAVSPQGIRRWVRQQLIQPTAIVHGLAFFDFHQVANAKHLQQLLEQGVSLAAIRRSVEELRECLPAEMLPLSQLSLLEGGRPLFRRDGDLIDSTGQRYFDFDASGVEPAVLLGRGPLEDEDLFELFDRAIELEDAEQFEAAADVYRRAVALEPEDPILHFNRGNVLFRLQQFEQAAVSFQDALNYDSTYVQAWNNLGNALAALQRFADAEQAFRRAISLVPHYADAHFNLANLLARLGRAEEAEQHRKKHQQFSSTELLANVYRVVRQELGGDDLPP